MIQLHSFRTNRLLSSLLLPLRHRGCRNSCALASPPCCDDSAMSLCMSLNVTCRPAYSALASLKSDFPAVPIAAVTATATSQVMHEVKQLLNLRQPQLLVSSFNRSNIQYCVRHKELIGDGSDEDVLQVITRLPLLSPQHVLAVAIACLTKTLSMSNLQQMWMQMQV